MTPSILEFIPNQPFVFYDTSLQEECCNACEEAYCLKYQPGDPIKIQFRQRWGQEDTKPNISCSPTFQDFVGGELVTNGDFPIDDSSWALYPAGGGTVAWNAGAIDVGIGASTQKIVQSIPALTVGKTYRVRFTLKNFSSGHAFAAIGLDVSPATHTGDGVFDSVINYLTGSAELTIRFEPGSAMSIDDISVLEVGPCWALTNEIMLSDSGITHLPGTDTTIYNSGTGLAVSPFGYLLNGTYAFRVKIKDRTAGTFKIKCGAVYAQMVDATGNVKVDMDKNGEFTRFINISSPNLTEYKMDADFDGTIESIYCYPLYSYLSGDGFVFHMTDLQDNYMGDMTPFVNYNQDYVIIYTSMDTVNLGLNPYGCYKIKVADPLPNASLYQNLLPQGDFNDNTQWTVPIGASVNDTSIASRVGRLFVSANGTISTNVTLEDGKTYHLWLNRIVNTASYTVTVKYGGVTVLTYGVTGGDPANSSHSFIVSSPVGDLLEITFSGLTSNTLFESALIFLDSYDYDAFAYESNCISYKEIHPCTKILDAYSPGSQHGFFFPSSFVGFPVNDYEPDMFSLWQRVAVISFNPNYPTVQETYSQSEGNDSLTHSSRKKYKVLHFDKVDEAVHDCISLQRICSHFFIYPGSGLGSSAVPMYDSQYRYVAKKEDYVPDNDKDGRRKLVQSRMEVALKKNNLFFTKEV